MSHLNTVPYLHTSKHTGKHTHSSYAILPHHWQLHPIDCSDSEKMMELYNTLSRSTHHQTAVRHTNAPSLMLIILKFQFSFLMKVFLNPVIYFLIYANIWSSLSVNTGLINAPSSPMDQHRSLILTPSSHMVFSPGFIVYVPISCTSIVAIYEPYFFPYMVFEYPHHILN